MKAYNRRLKIRTVVERWNEQYKDMYKENKDKLKILKKLESLNLSKCKAKDIDNIIGNPSWTHFMCMSCKDYKSRGVLFTDDYICLDCIMDSLDLFKHDALSQSSEVKKE